MPIQRCQVDSKPGLKWGSEGKCYIYTAGDKDSRDKAREKAIAQGVAIGDIDAEEASIKKTSVILIELATDSLTEGKAFDGFIAGDFVDMHNRRILVEDDELDDYLSNTQAAIEATRSESGEIVGLPIDVLDHEKEDAAGWIIAAELDEVETDDGPVDLIRLFPKWTEFGVELIEKGIRRFFSATFNTAQKVILGGSLTNWPATRDEEGKILLRPIELTELSDPMFRFEFQEESIEDRLNRIRADFTEQFPNFDNRPFLWVEDSFEDFVIVSEGAENFRVEYEEVEDSFEFVDRDVWVEVKQTWIEAARQALRDILRHGPRELQIKPTSKKMKAGGRKMSKTNLDDLSPEEKNELTLGLVAELGGEELADLTDAGKQLDNLVVHRARKMVEEETRKAQHAREIAEFSKKITGGDEETPTGLPMNMEQLETFLSSLDEGQLKAATALFEEIVEKGGVIEFSEHGHGRRVKGNKELPKEYAEKILSGDLKLADLRDPVIAADIGDVADYDLSAFEKED